MLNPNPEIEPEKAPVGAVARIRHYNDQGRRIHTETGGPFRHLGHGWYIPARYAAWADLVPLVEEWARTQATVNAAQKRGVDGMVTAPEAWMPAYTRHQTLHLTLNEAGAWVGRGQGAKAKLLSK